MNRDHHLELVAGTEVTPPHDVAAQDQTVTLYRSGHEYILPRCAYVAEKLRCAYAGTITDTTLCTPASRWFCRHHFDCRDAKFGAMVVEESNGRKP